MPDLVRITNLPELETIPEGALVVVEYDGVTYKAAATALQGEDGEDGADGAPGADGSNGSNGASFSAWPLYFGANTPGNSTSARYLNPGDQNASPQSTEAPGRQINPATGTLTKLIVKMSQSIAQDIVFTVVKNGSDTALTATITAGQTEASVTSGNISVTEFDLISLKSQTAGGAVSTTCDIRAVVVGS